MGKKPGLPCNSAKINPDPMDSEENSISILCGNGRLGCGDGNGEVASFNQPYGICMISGEKALLVVSDSQNNTLRLISDYEEYLGEKNHVNVHTLCNSSFLNPRGICLSGKCILVCDSGHHKIKILCLPKGCIDGTNVKEFGQASTTTLAGIGRKGWKDGGVSESLFHTPSSICVYKDGSVIVSDTGNHCIRRIKHSSCGKLVVKTIAGSLCKRNDPQSIDDRNVEIFNSSSTHSITGKKLAGFQDGDGNNALFRSPMGIATGNYGEILVADSFNNCIRAIIPLNLVDGESACSEYISENDYWRVQTIVGQTKSGHRDGGCHKALFNQPVGICVAGDGTIFVSDKGNNCIRQIGGCQALSTGQVKDCISYDWVRTIAIDKPAASRFFVSGFEPSFHLPRGVCAIPLSNQLCNNKDNSKNIYVSVCDTGNNLIRLISIEPVVNPLDSVVDYESEDNRYSPHYGRENVISRKMALQKSRWIPVNANEFIESDRVTSDHVEECGFIENNPQVTIDHNRKRETYMNPNENRPNYITMMNAMKKLQVENEILSHENSKLKLLLCNTALQIEELTRTVTKQTAISTNI